MTIPDPPWKRKTRPCPFYSQGRCLFSDSCNFLHEVKIKVKNPEIAIISSPTPQSTPALSRTNSLSSSPGSPSSFRHVRSPPRSPRLSSLLLALGDVIEPEAEEVASDEEYGENEDDTTRPEDLVPPDALLGKVLRQRSDAGTQENEVPPTAGADEGVSSTADEDDTIRPSEDLPPKAAFDLVLRQMSSLGVVNDLAARPVEDIVHSEEPAATEPLVEASDTTSEAPAQSDSISRPSSLSGRNNHAEGSDLMSPVELTMAPPFWHPIGQLPPSHHREDSMDSGNADSWSGPIPFALSPPNKESSKRFSTLSLLSSPFGSPGRAISPKFGPPALSTWPSSPRAATSDKGLSSEHDSDTLDITLDDELDSPTEYAAERRRQSTASHTSSAHVDLESTVKQSVAPALHEGPDAHSVDLGVPSMMSLVVPSDSLPTPSFSTPSVFSFPHAPTRRSGEPNVSIASSSQSSDVNLPSSVFSPPPTNPTPAPGPDAASHISSPLVRQSLDDTRELGTRSLPPIGQSFADTPEPGPPFSPPMEQLFNGTPEPGPPSLPLIRQLVNGTPERSRQLSQLMEQSFDSTPERGPPSSSLTGQPFVDTRELSPPFSPLKGDPFDETLELGPLSSPLMEQSFDSIPEPGPSSSPPAERLFNGAPEPSPPSLPLIGHLVNATPEPGLPPIGQSFADTPEPGPSSPPLMEQSFNSTPEPGPPTLPLIEQLVNGTPKPGPPASPLREQSFDGMQEPSSPFIGQLVNSAPELGLPSSPLMEQSFDGTPELGSPQSPSIGQLVSSTPKPGPPSSPLREQSFDGTLEPSSPFIGHLVNSAPEPPSSPLMEQSVDSTPELGPPSLPSIGQLVGGTPKPGPPSSPPREQSFDGTLEPSSPFIGQLVNSAPELGPPSSPLMEQSLDGTPELGSPQLPSIGQLVSSTPKPGPPSSPLREQSFGGTLEPSSPFIGQLVNSAPELVPSSSPLMEQSFDGTPEPGPPSLPSIEQLVAGIPELGTLSSPFMRQSFDGTQELGPLYSPPATPLPSARSPGDEQENLDDDTNLYGSYYQEIPVSNMSEQSTPQLTRALSRAASLRSSVRRTPRGLPSVITSPTGSVASTSNIPLLRSIPSGSPSNSRDSVLESSFGLEHVDSNIQHVLTSPRVPHDLPLSAPPQARDEPVSPYGMVPPVQASSVPSSPSASTQPFAPDFTPRIGPTASRRSSKVPFGFRHSVAARKRDSLITPRPESAPLVRHRPPALVGISSNRSNSLSDPRPDLASPMESIPSANKLRPLRLSILLNSPSSGVSFNSAISPSPLSSGMFSQQTADITPATSHPPASPSVHSDRPLSNKSQASLASSHPIPSNILANILIPTDAPLTLDGSERNIVPSPSISSPYALWDGTSSPSTSYASHRLSHLARPSSRLSEPVHPILEDVREDFDEVYNGIGQADLTIRDEAISSGPPYPRPSSTASYYEPVHAIATPRPTLLFAIASDNVDEVRKVLESGEAGPNDDVGPQSALAFALTANNLRHKADIVKTLLAHGANPSSIRLPQAHSAGSSLSSFGQATSAAPARPDVLADVDPATRYYIARADAPQTRRASSLIHRSFFQPLARVRYDLVGQDRALEQLFRVLSMPSMAPIVVLLCGPSGHGKSLLARRFGSLLDVPTHTVNMTTLRSTRDIWRSYSMNPYEAASDLTLADFLMENEGKRCVVVLDEIEKTENETILSSLLMPWELGRVSFEAGHRHVDCSKVIWLGTSNIGHDMVFEHQASRTCPDEQMSRDEYVDLMKLLRPKVSERLGPSLLSRVTTVLPFVPFTPEEKLAIATEALFALTEDARTLPSATVEKLVKDSLQNYVSAEGARSLYRAVSTLLLDTL